MIKTILEEKPDLRSNLFIRGFLLTTNPEIPAEGFPFYGSWNRKTWGNLHFWTHPLTGFHTWERNGKLLFLLGHAYNPFTMETDETIILENLLERIDSGNGFYDYLDQITGSFCLIIVNGERVSVFSDCAGMYGANYCVWNSNIYISSHYQMIADLCAFEEDPYITSMKRSRTWPLYGYYLPNNLTAYSQIKRVLPNVEVIIENGQSSLKRFYPRQQYNECGEVGYEEVVRKAGDILHNSMRIIAQKWEKPAVSLTGGMDSKTTLACAYGIQDKFNYYSYISLPREATDAYAAKEICSRLGLQHEIIDIKPEDCSERHDALKSIIRHNCGNLGDPNDNDVDKRIELIRQFNYSIEVKSWVSEIARASRYGKYRKKRFASKPTPRMLTSMYKIFLGNRKDARATDAHFKEYLENTQLLNCLEKYHYPWTEFFVWEIVFAGWGGLALTGEHMVSNNITVPYNNRMLLDIMLKAPLEKRRTDTLHRDIISYMDRRVNETGISVVNGNETTFRAVCERLYYEIHSHIPF